MNWAKHRRTWPHADVSYHLRHGPHEWHLQVTGDGPDILLLHGAGASTHSWRELIPLLATDHRVVAIDLPGHGFTRRGTRMRSGLPQMATDIAGMLEHEDIHPHISVGHSAGVAIALELQTRLARPAAGIVGINAALGNFPGLAGVLFPMMAKLLSLSSLTAAVFSGMSTPGTVRNLIRGTGSQIDETGLALYRQLIADRAHVDGALGMMAQWDLAPLIERLPHIATDTLFLTGERDKTVPPETSAKAAARMPHASVETFPTLGHLAHEEAPDEISARILTFSQHCAHA